MEERKKETEISAGVKKDGVHLTFKRTEGLKENDPGINEVVADDRREKIKERKRLERGAVGLVGGGLLGGGIGGGIGALIGGIVGRSMVPGWALYRCIVMGVGIGGVIGGLGAAGLGTTIGYIAGSNIQKKEEKEAEEKDN